MWRSHLCSLDACEYFARERNAATRQLPGGCATQRVIMRKRFLLLNPRTESNRTNSDSHRILDIRIELKYIPIRKAAVAELVDASDLGSGERLLVGVRVSPAAHCVPNLCGSSSEGHEGLLWRTPSGGVSPSAHSSVVILNPSVDG